MCKTGTIYLISFTYGKFEQYVGQTTATIRSRESTHLADDTLVDRKMNAHPDEYFITVIEEDIPLELLDEKERYYIANLHTFDCVGGLNQTSGGGANSIASDETRRKMSESKKGWYKTHQHPHKGIPLDEEWIKSLSEGQKRRYETHEGTMKGKHFSEESRKKMSRAQLEYFKTHDAPMKGRKHTKEALQKMSDGHKEYYKNHDHHYLGKHRDEETRKKISESLMKKNWPKIQAYLDWEWLMTQGINTQFPIELITQAVKDGR